MANSPEELEKRWVEIRPPRIEVAQTYARRFLNTWGNSSPYLSGDLFSDMSDISFNSPRFRRLKPSLRDIADAKVIFCPSQDLEYFFTKYKGYANPKILICGNSDRDFHFLPEGLPPTLRHIFLQNSFIPNSRYTTGLPIGLENLRWGKNGYPRLMKNQTKWSGRINKVMMGPFGLTHEERYQVRKNFKSSNECVDLFSTRLTPRELSRISQNYRFIAAVRGNGVDTHRHWEAAYRGSFSVVKKSLWSENFKSLDLPFLEVEDWSESELARIVISNETSPKNPSNVAALWWPFWKTEIGSKLDGN